MKEEVSKVERKMKEIEYRYLKAVLTFLKTPSVERARKIIVSFQKNCTYVSVNILRHLKLNTFLLSRLHLKREIKLDRTQKQTVIYLHSSKRTEDGKTTRATTKKRP